MRVLQMVSALDGGGIERIIYNYYLHMDRSKIHFDFVKVESEEGILEEPLRKLGCNIFGLPQLRKKPSEYRKKLKAIIINGKYDVIHCNGGYRAFEALRIAKKCGVPIRIAHAHTSNPPETIFNKIERIIATVLTKHYATRLLACGEQAARWMWGDRKYESGNINIVHNAICTDLYKFNNGKRKEIRDILNIEDKFVIGNVGRLSLPKNHKFMIDIIDEVVKKRKDIILLLVGCGELELEVKEYVNSKNLNSFVKFLGVRKDVPDLLNAMDLFILPSLFEGLPVTAVEVQANGLPSLISNNVTKEIKINKNVEYLPLDKKVWVEFLTSYNFVRDFKGDVNIVKAGYDIDKEANRLINNYY